MSKLSVTNFNKRTGSPFQNKNNKEDNSCNETNVIVHQEVVLDKSNYDVKKEKQQVLQEKVNKKTAEITTNKMVNNKGFFTEVVSHGAFHGPKAKSKSPSPESKCVSPKPPTNNNGSSASKSLMGFPSSANDLALEAKSDLESDKNISDEVKEKVIKKLFALVSMVQHTYESKVRIMAEYEKFKEKSLKEESRREKEHSEQLYKLNINFQSEVIQAIQQLRTELDISRCMTKVGEDNHSSISSKSSIICNNQDHEQPEKEDQELSTDADNELEHSNE